MKRILEIMANLLTRYGRFGAGMASVHGSYEAPVPAQLQAQHK